MTDIQESKGFSGEDGQWFCPKCGYISPEQVTFHEQHEICGEMVEWHDADMKTEIECKNCGCVPNE